MTTSDASPVPHAWRPHEAQVLAGLLRGSRLTVVYAAAAEPMAALLRSGVLPLLRSGSRDWVLDERRVLQIPIPFPERRADRAAAGLQREVVIDLDDWRSAPLAALQARLRDSLPQAGDLPENASLADTLALLHERLGVRFLFVFDRFDVFLEAPRDREDVMAFSRAFIEVAKGSLPANFLIVLSEEAKPLLKRLRRRIPGLAQHALRLSSRDDGSLELLPVLEPDTGLRLGSAANSPHHAPQMKTEEVYASIEAWLAKNASGGGEAQRQLPGGGQPGGAVPPKSSVGTGVDTARLAIWRDSAVDTGSSPAGDQLEPPPTRTPVTRRSWLPRQAIIIIAATLPLLLGAWWLGERAGRESAVFVPVTPPTQFALMVDPEASTDARAGAELARHLDAGVSLKIDNPPNGAPAWVSLQGPQVAIMSGDALQAAQASGSAQLRIVTPLFAEEVQVIVRADSPLKSVRQLKGRRINVGPANGARARTAGRLYEALFGVRPTSSPAAALPLDEALRLLLDRRELDALILVDAQPSPWLAAQSEQTLRRTRMLRFDDLPPERRKALQEWQPAVLSDDTATLAQTSYLVTSAAQDDTDPEATGRLALALCHALPALRRDGHPKWLEVQPGGPEDAVWPYSPSAVRAFRACASESAKP